jgi:hypothetical protein
VIISIRSNLLKIFNVDDFKLNKSSNYDFIFYVTVSIGTVLIYVILNGFFDNTSKISSF